MKHPLRIIAIAAIALGILIYIGGRIDYAYPLRGRITKDSRTLYEGFVLVESVSLDVLRAKLDANGCARSMGEIQRCFYAYANEVSASEKKSIEIFPRGVGFGPLSFAVTEENKIKAIKDIPGAPDIEKFKVEVRKDVADAGLLGILVVREDTWKLTKTTYPWDVQY